jgi:hypothetical protein
VLADRCHSAKTRSRTTSTPVWSHRKSVAAAHMLWCAKRRYDLFGKRDNDQVFAIQWFAIDDIGIEEPINEMGVVRATSMRTIGFLLPVNSFTGLDRPSAVYPFELRARHGGVVAPSLTPRCRAFDPFARPRFGIGVQGNVGDNGRGVSARLEYAL